MKFSSFIVLFFLSAGSAFGEFIHADDPRLEYSDYVNKQVIRTPEGKPRVRFDRLLRHNRNYNRDNPGARLRFRTDATALTVHLYYNELHTSPSARNGVGVWRIDAKGGPEWQFNTREKRTKRAPEKVLVALPSDGKFHDYELILPYGDSVDIDGVEVNDGAKFAAPAPRPQYRVVFHGDSVTHGHTASRIDRTYPWLVGEKKNWQIINTALGGISSAGLQPAAIASIPMDRLVVMIGVNDWQGGRKPEAYAADVVKFLREFRRRRPETPVALITPLWVGPKWQPKSAKFELPEYRLAVEKAVKQLADPRVKLIDGEALIDHDAKKFFTPVAVHPNDAGFAQLAERLVRQL